MGKTKKKDLSEDQSKTGSSLLSQIANVTGEETWVQKRSSKTEDLSIVLLKYIKQLK